MSRDGPNRDRKMKAKHSMQRSITAWTVPLQESSHHREKRKLEQKKFENFSDLPVETDDRDLTPPASPFDDFLADTDSAEKILPPAKRHKTEEKQIETTKLEGGEEQQQQQTKEDPAFSPPKEVAIAASLLHQTTMQRTMSTPLSLLSKKNKEKENMKVLSGVRAQREQVKEKEEEEKEEKEEEEPFNRTKSEKEGKKVDRSKSILKLEYELEQGHKIQVRHGDITQEDVDAIVNAANSSLVLGGGVAGAIRSAGGPNIQKECDLIVNRHGSVENGGVRMTGAGEMISKCVIHAVGPIWHNGNSGEQKDLKMAVWNCLKAASEVELESISMPAISSGIFGFPKTLCAKIMLSTAYQFCQKFPKHSVKEIRFTNFDLPTVSIFEKEFTSMFIKTAQMGGGGGGKEENEEETTTL